jgi:hypothetical protein
MLRGSPSVPLDQERKARSLSTCPRWACQAVKVLLPFVMAKNSSGSIVRGRARRTQIDPTPRGHPRQLDRASVRPRGVVYDAAIHSDAYLSSCGQS